MNSISRIQKYLDGKMSENELKEFREDLQKDPELVQELDLYRSLDRTVASRDEERFRKKLSQVYAEFKELPAEKTEKAPPSARKLNKKWLVAVSATLISTLSLLFYFVAVKKESNQAIFEKYMVTYSTNLTLRSHAQFEAGKKRLEYGIQLYTRGNYSDASQQFKMVLSEDSENQDARFYNGLCYMYLNEFQSAITSFEYILTQPYSFVHENAKFYLALCYVRINNNETAKALLQEIISDNSSHSDIAQKVLEKLR